MKTNISNAERGTRNSQKRNAFTMIEIAIALAVIAFALVAIIGVLPTGMNVQKDNREDTIINQDGPYWLEAIRSGNKGLDYLTNYVDTITVKSVGKAANGNNVDSLVIFTNSPGASGSFDGSMTNGRRIIGILSIPKYEGELPNRITNTVTAKVRALTGSAVEQGKANPDFSFDYSLTSEILPFAAVQVPVASTNFNEVTVPALTPEQIAERKANWVQVKSREQNASEIRLIFRWPLLPNDETGPGRQTFRAIVSGARVQDDDFSFFQPRSFQVVQGP